MRYQGGYILINEPLVRSMGGNGHTANDMGGLSKTTVQAVNILQDTPWAVNKRMLQVVGLARDLGQNLVGSSGDVVLRVEEPADPRGYEPFFERLEDDEWAAMPDEDKVQWRANRQFAMEDWKSSLGEYRTTLRTISAAEEMAQFDHFYFPHNMDFRTRVYPIPATLTPQSNDLSKGLLRFARPMRLGAEGLYWMGFMVATHFGEDKLHPDDRFQWALDHLGDIKAMVEGRSDGWLDADAPFQFLAVAQQWVDAMGMKCSEDYMSTLPGNLDGSCNGAQHLSIMSRDPVGCVATNCSASNERHDLYMEVADRALDQVQSDLDEDDNEVALIWLEKMKEPSARRKVVKRAVMTVPYGVTKRGVAEFMISDGHVEKTRNKWDQATYMRDCIMNAVEGTMEKGRELQRYFSECAKVCSDAGKPLTWETPSGSIVSQAYLNMTLRRIKTRDHMFVIYEEPGPDEDGQAFATRVGFDRNKMATAAPPNVVHSCDAAHLQLTVCRMRQAGIRDYSMIHDSFGCPFAQMGTMRDILRDVIVEMYSGNFLLRWKNSVERHTGVKLPKPPKMGKFDIEQIRGSVFFFS